MIRTIVFGCFFWCGLAQAFSVASGQLVTFWSMPSEYVAARDVHVWLPPHYRQATLANQEFAVLYMHDGQMLFDASTTWNGQEWGVDEIASELMGSGKTQNFIVVGINNGGQDLRHAEYFPQKPFNQLSQRTRAALYELERSPGQRLFGGNPVQSDNYLKFLVTELKPLIDRTFAVKTDRDHTFVMGSSMGGLISLYAISEYPSVFGGAACLSTHWPGTFDVQDNPIPQAFFDYMQQHLPDPATHILYFDYGDATLDALYPPLQKRADAVLHKKGFSAPRWTTRFFSGAEHSERAWRARLQIPLMFLLAESQR